MLTLAEKILFVLAVLATLYIVFLVVKRISAVISRGHGKPDWNLAKKRLGQVIVKTGTLQPTFKTRFWSSLFHAFIAWGFMYYLLVNLGDILGGFILNFHFLGSGGLGGVYRLLADLLSVGVLVGMSAMLIRRFLFQYLFFYFECKKLMWYHFQEKDLE